MDVASKVIEAVQALRDVSDKVKYNKEQCQIVSTRCVNILQEFNRLPGETQAGLQQRGVFADFLSVTTSAVDFSCGFSDKKSWFKKVFSYREDADKFKEIIHRLDSVVDEAALSLAFDQRILSDAQLKDAQYAEKMLVAIMDKQDATLEILEENKEDIQEMRRMLDRMIVAGTVSAAAASDADDTHLDDTHLDEISTTTATPLRSQRHQQQQRRTRKQLWEVNPREIEFEYEEDVFGEKIRVTLGKGSFGTVFRGRYRGEDIAVKCIPLVDSKSKDLALTEVKILHRLHHPNLAVCYGAHIGKQGVIVMELLQCTLEDKIHGSCHDDIAAPPAVMSMAEKIRYCIEMADGLNYLHNTNPRVIHRDFKPANVMLTSKDVVRIIDFGLADVRQSTVGAAGTNLQGQVGTLVYRAPEIFDPSERQTRKVDVYAFGISTNELFHGKRPYSDKFSDLNTVPYHVVHKKARPTLATQAPRWLQSVILSCWNQAAESRPDINIVFMKLMQQDSPTTTTPPPPPPYTTAGEEIGEGTEEKNEEGGEEEKAQRFMKLPETELEALATFKAVYGGWFSSLYNAKHVVDSFVVHPPNKSPRLDLNGKVKGNDASKLGAVCGLISNNIKTFKWNGQKLTLRENEIGDDGAIAIANALAHNTTLKSIYLSDNDIGDTGCKAIATTLSQSTTLSSIELTRNSIGDDGGKAMAKTLHENLALEWIYLSGNSIGDEGCKAIAAALLTNTKLKALYLIGNNIGDEGGMAIADALDKNKTLKFISLWDNNISDDVKKIISTSASKRKGLHINV